MYLATAEALTAVLQLADARSLGSASVVRQQMITVLRQFVTRCRDAGIADAETAEARYALVAFIDDRVLRSNWPGRAEWQSQPLQLQFFREFTAGENFFARMAAMAQRGGPYGPLEAYYLCLALGFGGAMPRGHTAREFLESARTVLLRGQNPDWIAPNAIPPDRTGPRSRLIPVAALVALVCTLLCVTALVVISLFLGRVVDGAHAEISPQGSPVTSTLGGR
jgi:type VI secretion system protein ImpK